MDEDIEDGTTGGWGRFDGKSRLWRDEAGETGGGRGGVAACLQILYRALQPPIRRFPVHQQLSRALTTTSSSIHP